MSCPELQRRIGIRRAVGRADSIRSLLASKLELASGGTLFLDAVHELPLELQRELSRTILERPKHARARGEVARARMRASIASTTREPRRAGDAGPSSRSSSQATGSPCRRSPIGEKTFRRSSITSCSRHARQTGKPVDGVSPESMSRLETYPWPGNIRELHTVLERAILVAKSPVLEIDEELLDDTADRRQLSPDFAAGIRRHGRGLARETPAPGSSGGREADSAGTQPVASREQLVRRFQREAQVTARLRSPHTVQLYDFGVNETGSFYYVMELLQGLDLHTS